LFSFACFFIDEAQKKLEEYATKDSKSSNNNTKKTSSSEGNSSQSKSNVGKSSKRSNLKKRTDKTNYSHNWLLTTLKGHTGSVMDMSFSANGKYLATCADGEFSFCFPTCQSTLAPSYQNTNNK
jgi:WD40 repeat protein